MALCQHFMYHMFLSQYFKYSTFVGVWNSKEFFLWDTRSVEEYLCYDGRFVVKNKGFFFPV